MPNSEHARQLGEAVIKELEYIGGSTAPVACIQVEPTADNEGLEFVFITRGPFNRAKQPSLLSINYVSYRLPLGRLAEAIPGEETTVTVEERVGQRLTRTGRLFEKNYSVRCKDLFRVSNDAPLVDAVENSFVFPGGNFNVASLRDWLSHPAEEAADLLAQPVRRRADRFELADLAVVDQNQGEIWRLNIRKFIVIAGAPGTGKTTTAIKRIGQKTDYDALINGSEVTQYPSETLQRWLQGPTGWVFFTPSELLRNYLREALAKEGLAATEEHVPVWAMARERIARDVLRFIGQDRFMSLRKNLVATRDSKHLAGWTTNFVEHFNARIQTELARSLLEQSELLIENLGKIDQKRIELEKEIQPLRASLEKLQDDERMATSDKERDEIHHRMHGNETTLIPLSTALKPLDEVSGIWREVAAIVSTANSTVLGRTLTGLFSLKDRIRDFQQRVPETNWPEADRTALRNVIAATKRIIAKFVDESGESLD